MKQLKKLLKKFTEFRITPQITKLYQDALEKDIFGKNPKKKSIYISKTKKPSKPRLVQKGDFKASLESEGNSKQVNIGFSDDKRKVQALIKKYENSYYTLSDAEKARLSKEITKEIQKTLNRK